ncbi:MAG: hybrid sensor histidine kinase/response regulator [Stigonema ocellatum SAG 48.90 = DSM 106950]|nr:hybrid sensor histidine kinase/response regulator [Stigonema ocellatum SAG 48.90 = DSM 106950]
MMESNIYDSRTEIDDDVLVFEDNTDAIQLEEGTAWKIMIVDDDPEVHQATTLALKNFTFEGKTLNFIFAHSGKEAKQLIESHPDTAFILLDVVMETNDAGLEVVKYIREELKNQFVRIILRTGQPGEAPEESVILNYDINDYQLKVELTRQKLVTIAIATLRSYRDLLVLEDNRKKLTELNAVLEQQKATLTQMLDKLQQTELQLVQREKMGAIGNMVAGVAHEINNPIGFISGNLQPAVDYIHDLFELLDLYQHKFPNAGPEIEEEIAAIDLEYLREDLPKLISSMGTGIQRIRNITTSLLTFSRADCDRKVPFNIHSGIDSTILILKHRLKENKNRPEIKVVKDYGDLPDVECFPGQINQVFMNLLANAIDAFELGIGDWGLATGDWNWDPNQIFKEFLPQSPIPNHQSPIPTIRISTELNPPKTSVLIRIQDNGVGMSEEVKQKLFESLFTTKPVGKGTGLGLAIARQIVVEKHQGTLEVYSELGHGSEFLITIPVKGEFI